MYQSTNFHKSTKYGVLGIANFEYCSSWEPQLLKIVNKNHYENPNLNICIAYYSDVLK
jgi:hypothetical protein